MTAATAMTATAMTATAIMPGASPAPMPTPPRLQR